MRLRFLLLLALVLAAGVVPAVVLGDVGVGRGGGTPGTSSNFTLVGHNNVSGVELDGNTVPRGMNAAEALYTDPTSGKTYDYIGNRTDGSSRCGVNDARFSVDPDSCPHPHSGVLVVDVSDPSAPTVVSEFGQSFVSGTDVGQTSRELHVWPQQRLLMVMYFRCSSVIHVCPPSANVWSIRFFDLTDPVHPTLVSTYVPSSKPHEMYLWVDPSNSNRALLWISTPTVSANPDVPNLIITDISDARDGVFTEIAKGNWNQFFPGASDPANYDFDLSLHSMATTADGKKTYLAYLRGGFGILDTSAVVADTNDHFISLNDKLLTPVSNFVRWGAGNQCSGGTAIGCSESHSAVPVPGRPFEVNVDEVYGKFPFSACGGDCFPSFGWPWGWVRLINVANPSHPRLVGQYKIFQNTNGFTPSAGEENFNSYSSHNPTVTRNLIFDDWHSGGLQAIDISDPGQPTQGGWFSPTPEASVANEDPALSAGPNKVVMWSYPIIKDGLIYVVDIRNGLYILRYTGPHADEVNAIHFLEGNSNLGDAARLAKSGG